MKKSLATVLGVILVLATPLPRSARATEDLLPLFAAGETARILEPPAADPQLLHADLAEGMDHSKNKVVMTDDDFFPEFDLLAEKGIEPDIAFFLNMYGCGPSNTEAFQTGIFHAVDTLKIKTVLPMHGANKEWVYQNLVTGAAGWPCSGVTPSAPS